MSRAAAGAIVALALWLSGAVFAPLGAAPDSGWIAALPSWAALGAAAAAALILVAWRPPSHAAALLPLVAVLLPWMPGIDAGLIYAGPLVILVWAAVLALGWGAAAAAAARRCRCATDPRRATLAAFLIALAWTGALAWRVAPMVPTGDEPHYLIITQSLIADGDLQIENNHAQRDYAAYAAGDLRPQYLVRGADGAIYPIHAPGLPALAMPAFAAAGYPGVVMFLAVVMALASALVWRIAWLATADIPSAWFGWAIVTASCTWAFQSFLVFPDAFGAAAVACGLWLVLRLDRARGGHAPAPRPAALAAVGVALALLPWLHTRFAVLAGGLGLMILLRLHRDGVRPLVAFLAAPVFGALAWFSFFYAIYGTPSPIAPWGGTGESQLSWIPGGLAGMLFDQQFGLLPYAPALAIGLIGLVTGTAAGWSRATRLQVALLLFAAYIAASASYAMWWAGLSVPARLLTVVLPLLAPAGAVAWQRASSMALRTVFLSLLGWTIFATASLAFAGRGRFAWNVRQHKAGLWFEWLTPLVRWTEALPAFFRAGDELGRESLPLPTFHAVTLVWIVVLVGAAAAALLASRYLRQRHPPVVAGALAVTALVLALPIGTIIALRLQGADASSPAGAQVALLRRVSARPAAIIDLGARRVVPGAAAIGAMRTTLPPRAADASNVEIRSFGPLPAGRYRLTADPAGPAGDVLVGRGLSVASLANDAVDIVLPVDVNALSIRGASGRALALQPAGILARRWRKPAIRAMRYGPVTAFFVDDRVYAEDNGFWVGGARFANVVLQADPGVRQAMLEIVNAPVANHVSVIGGAQPFAADLAPRQAVLVPVNFDENGAARLQIDSRSGFVPAHADPANGDQRFLGVYVKVRGVS